MEGKRRWRRVDGVLLLDKSPGMTSNDALQKARRLFSAAKGGHTGTLDPMASGLLPLCFGEATKFANDLLDADKTYLAELRLGVRTTTADAEGEVIAERPVNLCEADLQLASSRFIGAIEQVPPMYSALKRDGVPLYKLARQGLEVERMARAVTIRQLDIVAVDLPKATLRVCCSKGTYIRTLVEDIGEMLGCGAHLTALRRERAGRLDLAPALTLDSIAAIAEEERVARCLLPVDALLQALPRVDLDATASTRFAHGNAVEVALPQGDRFRVYAEGILLGVALRDSLGFLQPQRLICRPE